jgi:hypothetical protein
MQISSNWPSTFTPDRSSQNMFSAVLRRQQDVNPQVRDLDIPTYQEAPDKAPINTIVKNNAQAKPNEGWPFPAGQVLQVNPDIKSIRDNPVFAVLNFYAKLPDAYKLDELPYNILLNSHNRLFQALNILTKDQEQQVIGSFTINPHPQDMRHSMFLNDGGTLFRDSLDNLSNGISSISSSLSHYLSTPRNSDLYTPADLNTLNHIKEYIVYSKDNTLNQSQDVESYINDLYKNILQEKQTFINLNPDYVSDDTKQNISFLLDTLQE